MPRNFRDILLRNPASWVSAMASLWKPNSETRDKGSLNGSIKSGLKVFGSASENRSVIQHFLCLLRWLHMQLRLSVDHQTYRNTVLWAYSTIFQNPRLDVCSHSLKLWVVGEKKGHPEASKYLSVTTTLLSASTSGRILLFFWNADSITNKEVEPPDRCPPGLRHLSQINVSLGNL